MELNMNIDNVHHTVKKIYEENELRNLSDFHSVSKKDIMQKVSRYFQIDLYLTDRLDSNESNNLGNQYRIFISSNKPFNDQWQDFAFFIGCILLDKYHDSGTSESLTNSMDTARIFSFEFCAPYFLIKELQEMQEEYIDNYSKVLVLMNVFDINYYFATKRLTFLRYQKFKEQST
ncbi:ImmA/IrrE family metallo-endopeptidase [Oceanobacillus oncorhynchi]|uniref:ImmA/IrrE family metallo-endopeptidase n=1 Tax=Oceanobacillus oncorhynchi TaxID=545501 RepID=UPI0018660875|nr:ImmA/IrrE family metallo-endopeptidase [Oceanobacillus oncorhynchi]